MKLENDPGIDRLDSVYIIGNGVIGKALAVALSLNGKNVTILRGSVDGAETFHKRIQVETGNGTWEADIRISSISCFERLNGIILLTNKSFGNRRLAEKLRSKVGQSPIVFLQNGLNIEDSFTELGFTNLYRCVLLATSQAAAEDKVRFRLVAASPIGVINGSEKMLTNIVEQLTTSIFSFRAEPDIQPVIWKKVISNCLFNSICPLLETDNGVFRRNEAALEIGKKVIRECLSVARESGIQLTEDEVLENVLNISALSDGQKISTYQDILNGRETEIDSMNLAIADAAERLGIPVPITSLLGTLTKTKSEIFRGVE
ncbi:MAG: 2-dehydropantoate 2-reductase [Dyadobacter sp.]|uniref:ketopantoate reductase family protein n=1 Tax=Dyadobacter sp. TaxID=1914288 RepID=UPI001B0EFCF3|nr:2-dehydropantoate 2-reductase [Dyadobacter sp.]MBO9616245.1 2-dehydropantoate 2-reductase [Dyadobacter sp.]